MKSIERQLPTSAENYDIIYCPGSFLSEYVKDDYIKEQIDEIEGAKYYKRKTTFSCEEIHNLYYGKEKL